MTEFRKLADLAECQRLEAISPGGYVRARTGSGGQLQDLRIDPAGLRLTVEELEAEVVAAVTAAQLRYSTSIAAAARGAAANELTLAQLEEGLTQLDALAADLARTARHRPGPHRPPAPPAGVA